MKTDFVVTEDNQKIAYDLYPKGFKDLIIIAHGYYNSKQSLLLQELGEALNQKYDVLIMDFRGHGKSTGLFYWTAKEYLDLTAVLKNFRDQYQKIGVIGFSLGAATSIITAATTDLVDSLVAVSGPTEFGKVEFYFWKLDIENDVIFGLLGRGGKGKGVRPGPFWLQKKKPICLSRHPVK